MDLSITSEKIGGENLAWLDSREGVSTARTITLDHEKFSSAPDGIVKAGTPVQLDEGGKYKPYADDLAGFTLRDVRVSTGDAVVALLDRGRINVDQLPVAGAFAIPANGTRFEFLGKKEA